VCGLPDRLNMGCSKIKKEITVFCDGMQSGISLPVFWRNVLPQSSWQKITLKEEAVCSFKMLVTIYQTVRHPIPEDSNVCSHYTENLRSCKIEEV
jgi:hypothetical protein